MPGSLVVLTGASGGGKTTLARAIKERYPDECDVVFFDSVGVPSPEEMKKWTMDSSEESQAATGHVLINFEESCKAG
jgi:ABC-type glutathione transport system ATPase component